MVIIVNLILPNAETVRRETPDNQGKELSINCDEQWRCCIDRIKKTSKIGGSGTYCSSLNSTALKTLSELGYTIKKIDHHLIDVSWKEEDNPKSFNHKFSNNT